MLWHLAERFGTVGPDRVRVGGSLTQGMLGQLIGARRPTVSLALADLMQDGAVRRDKLHGWILDSAGLDRLEPELRRPERFLARQAGWNAGPRRPPCGTHRGGSRRR
jgi:hypothetical protein